MKVSSVFSFSHNFFLLSPEQVLVTFIVLSANIQFGQVQSFVVCLRVLDWLSAWKFRVSFYQDSNGVYAFSLEKFKIVLFGKELWINPFPHNDTFWRPWETSLLKTLGKGEIARYEQFLLFPQCFLPFLENFLSSLSKLKLSSANSFILEQSKILSFGNGLTIGLKVSCRLLAG